jgi:hypothetical protein
MAPLTGVADQPSYGSAPQPWSLDVVPDPTGVRVARTHGHWAYKPLSRGPRCGESNATPDTSNAHLVSNGL